jgi:hypothetical protein
MLPLNFSGSIKKSILKKLILFFLKIHEGINSKWQWYQCWIIPWYFIKHVSIILEYIGVRSIAVAHPHPKWCSNRCQCNPFIGPLWCLTCSIFHLFSCFWLNKIWLDYIINLARHGRCYRSTGDAYSSSTPELPHLVYL